MKKLICTIMACLMIVSMFSVLAFADTVQCDFTKRYFGHYNNAYYMYYAPKEWDENHCWGSTEISVSNDMYGYAHVTVTGVNNVSVTEYNRNNHSSDGYVKTEAAFVNVPYAKSVYYRGYRKLNGQTVEEFSRTIN